MLSCISMAWRTRALTSARGTFFSALTVAAFVELIFGVFNVQTEVVRLAPMLRPFITPILFVVGITGLGTVGAIVIPDLNRVCRERRAQAEKEELARRERERQAEKQLREDALSKINWLISRFEAPEAVGFNGGVETRARFFVQDLDNLGLVSKLHTTSIVKRIGTGGYKHLCVIREYLTYRSIENVRELVRLVDSAYKKNTA